MERIYEEQLIRTERLAQGIMDHLVTAARHADFRCRDSGIVEYIHDAMAPAEELARDVDRLCDYIRKLEGRC